MPFLKYLQSCSSSEKVTAITFKYFKVTESGVSNRPLHSLWFTQSALLIAFHILALVGNHIYYLGCYLWLTTWYVRRKQGNKVGKGWEMYW